MSRFPSTVARVSTLAAVGLLAAMPVTASAAETGSSAQSSAQIVVIDAYTEKIKESAGVAFTCPTNQVLIGRAHGGDENGTTTYYCALILIDAQIAAVSAPTWSGNQKESNSLFSAATDQVLVGRQHSGDENGQTRYATAQLSVGGRAVTLTGRRWTDPQKESSSNSRAGELEVMVGRQHSGDENGQTRYEYARLVG
ncbi:hypothetical protein LV78_004150 [Actinosynnema pretiosum]|uniref:hypothetical protein n=1 Tax=Actinosynnema pretiosum TaxID=42197 RepID=UPI0020A3B7AA|nr:hypothetical protein [Actinosynnema pretiosum]MCP2096164.1 hypothetical protein [Actinosynnema pretiosum]